MGTAFFPTLSVIFQQVYVRLGDVQRMNGNTAEAVEEYTKALALRSRISPNSHRILSNIHYLLAIAYIYKSSEDKNSDPIEEKRHALHHYELSRAELQKQLKTGSESSSSSAAATSSSSSSSEKVTEEANNNDVKELIDELTETIDALRGDIAEVIKKTVTPKRHSISNTFSPL